MTTTTRLADMSPGVKARRVGALLLITVVAGGFAQGFIGEAQSQICENVNR